MTAERLLEDCVTRVRQVAEKALGDEQSGIDCRARLRTYFDGSLQAETIGVTDSQRFAAHDLARDKAKAEMARAVAQMVALAEAEAIAKKKRRKEDDDEFFAWCALIFAAALAHAYGQAAKMLAVAAAGSDHGETLTQAEEEAFADSRQELLEQFPKAMRDRIDLEVSRGHEVGETEREIAARVRQEGDDIMAGAGRVLAETEAQTIYGASQLRALKRAGYESAFWVTVGDDRVRESHVACEAAGAVKLGDKFPNGLLYPGDPKGGPEEICNCRCWLEGASRKPKEEPA